jgi:hypothetical protein
MPARRALLALPALALLGGAAFAHHGWGSFDSSQVLDYAAPVVRSSFANPHGVVVLARNGAELTVELAPTGRMEARGLAAADIAPGKRVRVHAYRNRSNERLFRAEWIETEAGKRVQLR